MPGAGDFAAMTNKRKSSSRRGSRKLRAVIDIGSNTVRMVIYSGSARSPDVFWNEKVAARLGRDLSDSGMIPDDASREALGALARYAMILSDLDVENRQCVATAAARDAKNGAAFLSEVRALGLEPRLLSGEEEAIASASGALGAFPDAEGLVADLGGGSLELVRIANQSARDAASLPFGTLRLPAVRAAGGFEQTVEAALEETGFASNPGSSSNQTTASDTLYLVGGTWRALAAFAMDMLDYPLTDPHGFELHAEEAAKIAAKLTQTAPKSLQGLRGISPMRAEYLPDAAALLSALLTKIAPRRLVFSSWGLREGLLFRQLDPLDAVKDPLLAGVDRFSSARGSPITDASALAAWSVGLAMGDGRINERLRLASAQLAVALHQVEPNLRAGHAKEWALDKRWIALSPRGRAMIAAALYGSLGRTNLPKSWGRLASEEDLHEGVTWGLGFRLGHRLGAASRVSMMTSTLERSASKLTLTLDQSRAALAHYPVTRDLDILAGWLGTEASIAITNFEHSETEASSDAVNDS